MDHVVGRQASLCSCRIRCGVSLSGLSRCKAQTRDRRAETSGRLGEVPAPNSKGCDFRPRSSQRLAAAEPARVVCGPNAGASPVGRQRRSSRLQSCGLRRSRFLVRGAEGLNRARPVQCRILATSPSVFDRASAGRRLAQRLPGEHRGRQGRGRAVC